MQKSSNKHERCGQATRFTVLAVAAGASLTACMTTTPLERATPDLSAYNAFELFSQAAVATGKMQAEGSLQYLQEASQFEAYVGTSERVGRLHVQADGCRDNPSPECLRRFTASGRITAFESTLSCTVPIRNDSSLGYARQTLSGICQSQYGRTFTIHLFAK
jgi:hypothetical protein